MTVSPCLPARRAVPWILLGLTLVCVGSISARAADNRPSLGELEHDAGRETAELIHQAEEDLTHSGDDAHAGDAHGKAGHGGSTNPFDWQTDLALWTGVVFVVLMLVLWKFAWGPIAQGLDRREHGIADQIAQAENANAEAQELLAQYESKLAAAQEEVRGLIDEGRRQAEKQAQEILERARQEGDIERQRAMREIDQATAGAVKELAERSASLAVELAGRIVATELKPSDHERLIQQAVGDFAKQN